LIATAALTPEPAAAGHERPRVGAVAGGVDAVDRRRLPGVDGDRAVVAQSAAQPASEVVAQPPPDEEEQRIAVEQLAVGETDTAQATVIVAIQCHDRRLDDGHAERAHARELVGARSCGPLLSRTTSSDHVTVLEAVESRSQPAIDRCHPVVAKSR
jgi:hypothetical protein